MQRLDVNKNGINGWYCKRNIYNDILTIQCSCCGETRDSNLEKTAVLVQIRRSGIFSGVNMADADERELHADFFLKWCQETETEVSPLSDADLTAWIRQMEHIVLKGKTKLLKAKEIERGRKAKSKPWLVQSNDDIDINESIKQVKERKERQSKMSKVSEMLSGMLGVSGAEGLIKKLSGDKGLSVVTTSNRKMEDNYVASTTIKPNTNTQESLLTDISASLVQGIETRPIDDLVKAATTAAHIANKVLRSQEVKLKEPEAKPDEPFDWSKLTS